MRRAFADDLHMVVAALYPLVDAAGWVAQFQSSEYLESLDPMDFVVAPAVVVRPDLTLQLLPTALPLEIGLAAHGLALVDDTSIAVPPQP